MSYTIYPAKTLYSNIAGDPTGWTLNVDPVGGASPGGAANASIATDAGGGSPPRLKLSQLNGVIQDPMATVTAKRTIPGAIPGAKVSAQVTLTSGTVDMRVRFQLDAAITGESSTGAAIQALNVIASSTTVDLTLIAKDFSGSVNSTEANTFGFFDSITVSQEMFITSDTPLSNWSTTDLEYLWLLIAAGGASAGANLSIDDLYILLGGRAAVWAGASGLTPASSYSTADHKRTFLINALGADPSLSITDLWRMFLISQLGDSVVVS